MILLLYSTYVCSPVLHRIIYKPLMAFWWNAKIRWMKKASGGKIVRYVIRWMKYNRVDRTGDLFVLRGCVPFNSIDHIVHIQPELTVSIGFPLKIHISYWFFLVSLCMFFFMPHTTCSTQWFIQRDGSVLCDYSNSIAHFKWADSYARLKHKWKIQL